MKKEYVAPTMVCEEFAANEYVAACGDENRVYKFVCDAPGGELYYYPNSDGNIDGQYNGTGSAVCLTSGWLSSYSPCNEKHEAPTTAEYYDGYVIRNGQKHNVIVWRGVNNNNGHATAQLDMDSWETAKS